MRPTLACSLALVLLLGCASSEDKVENDSPGVSEDDVADDDAEDGTDDDAQGGANDDDGLPGPGEPGPAASADDDDADDDAADDDTADDDRAEPEPSSDDDDSAGTGGGANDDDGAQGGTSGNESDGDTDSDTGGTGGTGGGGCPRPEADYTFLGAECDLADFDCENYFRDECGCGCDDVSETLCRPDDEYVALGDSCDLVRFTCDDGAYFRDDCGCGCTSSDETTCSQPSDRYVLDDPAACTVALFACDVGEEIFHDDCGCGCRPTGNAECVAPSGTAIAVTENQIRRYECFQFTAEPMLIATEEEYLDFVNSCGGTPAEELDFDGHVYFAAVIPERTVVDFAYAVETNDGVHVGVQAEAYCGGAAPPTTVLLIEFDPIDAVFIQDRCDTGMCDPDVLPP